MASLFVKDGSGGGRAVELRGGRAAIGRGPDNDIQLEDRTVSRYHALLTARGDGWYITDLGSHNKTLVNGAPILEERLNDSDEIRLGDAVLVFTDQRASVSELILTPREGDRGEITQTIRLSELGGLRAAGARALSETVEKDRRLSHLLALTELAISVRSLQALFDGVVQILRRTLVVDRAVPILEEQGRSLQPYIESKHDFGESLEGLDINVSLLEKCRREGVAVVWRGAGQTPNVACAPVRVGLDNHGFLYCGRTEPSAEFTNRDLTYLLAVAMQTGLAIENIRCYQRMSLRARSLSRQLEERYDMVGESDAMRAVYEFIRKVAPTDAGVLICGESGTGKELVARAIHHQSRRNEGPLEIVGCAAVPPTLLESELFGHVRGAFTGAVSDKPGRFELADGGTLFLDEVVELPVECQTPLLRVLEEGQVRRIGDTWERAVDVRLVAATSRDLEQAVGQGRLRGDLFYRLDRLRVRLPPLRERAGDIELLAEHFLRELGSSFKRTVKSFPPEVTQAFTSYRWPGNVRELRNVVERMVLLGEGPELGLEDLPAYLRAAVRGGASGAVERLCEVERRHVLRVLKEANGNKKRAAQMLGIDRSTLYAKLRRYGMAPGEPPAAQGD